MADAKHTPEWARNAALDVLDCLKGRSGIGNEVEKIEQDDETHAEMVAELADAIAFAGPDTPPLDCDARITAYANGVEDGEAHIGGCACRWDENDNRTATCERHQGWLDVVHEWDERAKVSEAKSACGHPVSLMLKSAETGDALHCELCDHQTARADAERMENEWFERSKILMEALQDAVGVMDRFNDQITVGDYFSNAGQQLIEAVANARAAIAKINGGAA